MIDDTILSNGPVIADSERLNALISESNGIQILNRVIESLKRYGLTEKRIYCYLASFNNIRVENKNLFQFKPWDTSKDSIISLVENKLTLWQVLYAGYAYQISQDIVKKIARDYLKKFDVPRDSLQLNAFGECETWEQIIGTTPYINSKKYYKQKAYKEGAIGLVEEAVFKLISEYRGKDEFQENRRKVISKELYDEFIRFCSTQYVEEKILMTLCAVDMLLAQGKTVYMVSPREWEGKEHNFIVYKFFRFISKIGVKFLVIKEKKTTPEIDSRKETDGPSTSTSSSKRTAPLPDINLDLATYLKERAALAQKRLHLLEIAKKEDIPEFNRQINFARAKALEDYVETMDRLLGVIPLRTPFPSPAFRIDWTALSGTGPS